MDAVLVLAGSSSPQHEKCFHMDIFLCWPSPSSSLSTPALKTHPMDTFSVLLALLPPPPFLITIPFFPLLPFISFSPPNFFHYFCLLFNFMVNIACILYIIILILY